MTDDMNCVEIRDEGWANTCTSERAAVKQEHELDIKLEEIILVKTERTDSQLYEESYANKDFSQKDVVIPPSSSICQRTRSRPLHLRKAALLNLPVYQESECSTTDDLKAAGGKFRYRRDSVCMVCNLKLKQKNMKRHFMLKHRESLDLLERYKPRGPVIIPSKHGRDPKSKVIPRNDSTIACADCHETFKTESYLKRHVTKMHTPIDISQTGNIAKTVLLPTQIMEPDKIISAQRSVVFACADCNETFEWRSSLDRHIRRMHYSGFTCSVCNETFRYKVGLKRHIRKSHLNLNLNEFARTDKIEIKTHVKGFASLDKFTIKCKPPNIDHKGRKTKSLKLKRKFEVDVKPKNRACICHFCGKRVLEGSVAEHVQMNHGDLVSSADSNVDATIALDFSSAICGATFPLKLGWKRHMQQTHMTQVMLQPKSSVRLRSKGFCHVCGIIILKKNMKKHCEFKHSENAKPPKRIKTPSKCSDCGKIFIQKMNWKKHLLVHSIDNPNCNKCGKIYFTKEQVLNHLINTHNLYNKIYSCDQCGKEFRSKLSLYNHERRVHNKLCCDICGKMMPDLKGHKRLAHGNKTKRFMCDFCGKYLVNKISLMNHILVSHTGVVKYYQCEQCGSNFRHKGALQRHSRIHTGLKPWACENCDKRFHIKGSLLMHMLSHFDDRKHCCHVCDKKFKFRHHLTAHLRSHSGDRPFSCGVCNMRFITCGHLFQHFKTHKKEVTFECGHCKRLYPMKRKLREHILQRQCRKSKLYLAIQ